MAATIINIITQARKHRNDAELDDHALTPSPLKLSRASRNAAAADERLRLWGERNFTEAPLSLGEMISHELRRALDVVQSIWVQTLFYVVRRLRQPPLRGCRCPKVEGAAEQRPARGTHAPALRAARIRPFCARRGTHTPILRAARIRPPCAVPQGFVVIFQSLADTMRMPEEYSFNRAVKKMLIERPFDSSHNTFTTIRRPADVYEWGSNVLIPGLIVDSWLDGEGTFGEEGSAPFGIAEIMHRMDQFDWTEGIYLKQVRSRRSVCSSTSQMGHCYPELQRGGGSTDSFGRNWTHPQSPPSRPWAYHTVEQLGASPQGITSSAVESLRTYDADGYVALAIPFLSDSYLPEEEGAAHEVTNYRAHYVNATNGRTARFLCIRTSHNGVHVKQRCDPAAGPAAGPAADGRASAPLTGVVRAAVDEWWHDLKRAHFIDSETRLLTITLQLKSNHQGVRYRLTLMLEMTALGGLFPSFEALTRLLDEKDFESMPM